MVMQNMNLRASDRVNMKLMDGVIRGELQYNNFFCQNDKFNVYYYY